MSYTPANVTTAVMFTITLYVLIARFRIRRDASWPLAYYFFLVIYHQSLPGKLEPWVVYSGVVCGLFLRFEFLHKKLSRIVGICEMVILSYLAWRFVELAGTLY